MTSFPLQLKHFIDDTLINQINIKTTLSTSLHTSTVNHWWCYQESWYHKRMPFCGWSLIETSCWKSEWKSVCPLYTLNHCIHLAARTFSCPPICLLTRLTHFPCGLILHRHKLRVEWEGELSLFNNEFVLFCINNQAQLSVHLLNSYFERVLVTFWRCTRFLYQLCTWIEPFVCFHTTHYFEHKLFKLVHTYLLGSPLLESE